MIATVMHHSAIAHHHSIMFLQLMRAQFQMGCCVFSQKHKTHELMKHRTYPTVQ